MAGTQSIDFKKILDQIVAELKKYFNRRVANGKTKMNAINVVRNKILYRMFAVIKRQTPYVKLGNYAA